MICACYRHKNKVVVIHSYQLYGVRLEGFHSWQRVFFLYLYPFVPDGAEKDCIEIPYLLCGDCGHTAALRLPSPGHRNYFVNLHIVYSGDDTRGTLCLNLYRYNESQRIDEQYRNARSVSILAKISPSGNDTIIMIAAANHKTASVSDIIPKL